MPFRKYLLVKSTFVIIGARMPCAHAFVPLASSEFIVPEQVTGIRTNPALVGYPHGTFLVLWAHGGDFPTDVDFKARRFDASGAALTAEFAVNEHTTGLQIATDIQATADGGFVVSWWSDPRERRHGLRDLRVNVRRAPPADRNRVPGEHRDRHLPLRSARP